MYSVHRKVVYLQQFTFRHALPRKSVVLGIAGLIFYLLFLPKKYEITFTANVPESEQVVVWDFLSDFSNMKSLNPTMIDFTITFDKATHNTWEYGVRYQEFLSNLPFIRHSADATIKSYKILPHYFVESNHATCFIGNYFCLNTSSVIKCSSMDSETGKFTFVKEDNVFECPRLAYFFCHSEIVYQRMAVFKNLIKHFENTKY